MNYSYSRERERLFTDEGQRLLLRVRDRVKGLLATAGAFRAGVVIDSIGSTTNHEVMACIERLVELEELREVTKGLDVAWQNRIYSGRP